MNASPSEARPLTRKERQLRTRGRLLRSAVKVFASCGMHHASIDDVAAEAGFTKGAFYANFSSKEELFLAMLDERFAERLAQVQKLAATDHEVQVQARVAGEEFAGFLAADLDWQRLFFEFVVHAARNEPFRAELIARYGDLRSGIEQIVRTRAEQLGLELPMPAAEIALMTFAMANGFALERLLEPEVVSEELLGQMLVVFFTGLQTLAQEAGA